LNILDTNNKVQSCTTQQQTELDRFRSILQLYLNNGRQILCNIKLA